MSEITRRDVLRRLGLVLVTTGFVDRVSAQEVHQMASQAQAAAGGTYTPGQPDAARVPHARTAHRFDHSGRERRAWRGRRWGGGMDRHADERE